MTHRLARVLAALGCLVALGCSAIPVTLIGQVGDIPLPYPGWVASDGVNPTIIEAEAYNAQALTWTYEYTMSNGPGASQEIDEVWLRYRAGSVVTTTPTDWRSVGASSNALAERLAIPGVIFIAEMHDAFTGNFWPPPLNALAHGDPAIGFAIESDYPPGYARAYIRGYSGSEFEPDPRVDEDAYYAMKAAPHDTTDSQRRFTLGPTRYTEVVAGETRRPATDGFLGFMNLAVTGSTLRDPAPIALKFALNGETVFPNTLSVLLNGVDVTASFFPGPSDGADLVGVFRVGVSPLVVGENVLLTSVDGRVPLNGHTATDTDRIVFQVDPLVASGDGVSNLPGG